MNRRNLFRGLAGAALAGPIAVVAAKASPFHARTGECGAELVGLPPGASIVSHPLGTTVEMRSGPLRFFDPRAPHAEWSDPKTWYAVEPRT